MNDSSSSNDFSDIHKQSFIIKHITRPPVIRGEWTNYKLPNIAAASGDLESLKVFHKEGYTLNEVTCECAAKNGHLNCLKFLRQVGCPWNGKVCDVSFKNGHLSCLRFAVENGCPTSEKYKNHFEYAK